MKASKLVLAAVAVFSVVACSHPSTADLTSGPATLGGDSEVMAASAAAMGDWSSPASVLLYDGPAGNSCHDLSFGWGPASFAKFTFSNASAPGPTNADLGGHTFTFGVSASLHVDFVVMACPGMDATSGSITFAAGDSTALVASFEGELTNEEWSASLKFSGSFQAPVCAVE